MPSINSLMRRAINDAANVFERSRQQAVATIGRADVRTEELFGEGAAQLDAATETARSDINTGFNAALDNLFTGFSAAQSQLGLGTQQSLDFANAAFADSLNALQGTQNVDFSESIAALQQGFNQADQRLIEAGQIFSQGGQDTIAALRNTGALTQEALQASTAQALGILDPQIQFGTQLSEQAGGQLNALLGLGGDTQGALAALEATPGFQFRQQLGQQAIERSAAARGELLGGGTLAALSEFNQGLAGQQFDSQVAQLQNLLTTGLNAQNAARSQAAGIAQGAGTTQAGILTQLGLSEAEVANATSGQLASLLQQRAGLSTTRANALANTLQQEAQTNVGIQNQLVGQQADIAAQRGLTAADITQQGAQAQAGLSTALAGAQADIGTTQAGALSQLAQSLGISQADLSTGLAGLLNQNTGTLAELDLAAGKNEADAATRTLLTRLNIFQG